MSPDHIQPKLLAWQPLCSSTFAHTQASAFTSKAVHVCAAFLFLRFACYPADAVAQTSPAQPVLSQTRGVQVTGSPQSGKNDAWVHRKDHALLFATNDYLDWPTLINPIPDAEEIAKELEDNYGFEAEIVRDPTRAQIFEKLRDYINKPFAENDQLFIFFAGHGLYDETFQQGFIVAHDSRRDDPSRGTYASYDDLRARINAIHIKHIFLALDACYSGTFDPRIGEEGTRGTDIYANFSLPDLFQDKVRFTTRKYLTSGGKNYVSDGIPGHHSPFVAHLLEALRSYGGKQGFLTLPNVLAALQRTNPVPYAGYWGADEPGSEFFFISAQLTAELKTGQPTGEAKTAMETAVSGGHGVQSQTTAKLRPAIAVLGFKNSSRRTEDAWLSTALAEAVTAELASSADLRAVPGESVAKAKLDQNLQDLSGYTPETLRKVSKALAADYVISGSYTAEASPTKHGLYVNVWLQNAHTGDFTSIRETSTQKEWSDLAARAAARLRIKLGAANPSPGEVEAAKATVPSVTEAARLYATGLARLRTYDLLGARDTLERAVKEDPNFALAHLALARTLAELGYDSLAAREAALAKDRAGGLPQPTARLIEGTYLKLTGDWEAAIKKYSSLWEVYPDEIEYALELANIQSSAGKGRDALATLDEVRKRSMRAAEDPRVDLEEAYAASTLADFKMQYAAAERAIRRAGDGSRLLAAQAYWRECSALLALGQPKDAETACSQASQISEFSGGEQMKARSVTVLANVMVTEGRISEAMALRQQALALAKQIGSKKDVIGALMNLANLRSSQNQVEDAKRGYEEAIVIAREIGDRKQLTEVLGNSAGVLFAEGDYSGAREMYQQSLQNAKATGDKESIAQALQNLSLVAFQLGNLPEVKDKLHQSIEVAKEISSRTITASSLTNLGDLFLAQGDLSSARKAYENALSSFTELQDQAEIAITRQSLAELLLAEGKPPAAETSARQAVEEFEKEKNVDQEASARETLARALMEEGKQAEAIGEIEAAAKLPVEDRAVHLSLALTGARLSACVGKLKEARKSLEASLEEATQLKLVGLQLQVRLTLAEIESADDNASGLLQLERIENDARNAGYLLIATKARRASRHQPSPQ